MIQIKKTFTTSSFFMESYIKDLEKALASLTIILKNNNISFTVIGASARNYYSKSTRTTDDIDILVDIKDKTKMESLPIGFIRDISQGRARVFSLHNPKTKIEVLYSGEQAGNKQGIVYEDPHLISNAINNIPFITLKDLIRYKLSSGFYGNRYKDYGDIQDLIRDNSLPKNYGEINNFREDLLLLYEDLWEKTYDSN